MNPGGEPERDETGLPPVDIEIPDDARELDRDVQAYHRERRASRRRQRRNRWHRSLGRDGVVLPLLACCLILALITGTLLTVFTATSEQTLNGGPSSSGGASAGAGGSHPARSGSGGSAATHARPGSAGRPADAGIPPVPEIVVAGTLPRATIAANGRPPIQVSTLRRAMVVLVPLHCRCGPTLGWLADVAASAHAPAYVVYTPDARADVQQLYDHLSMPRRSALILAEESDGVLTSRASVPTGIQAGALTAIVVRHDGLALYTSRLNPRDNPTALMQWIST